MNHLIFTRKTDKSSGSLVNYSYWQFITMSEKQLGDFSKEYLLIDQTHRYLKRSPMDAPDRQYELTVSMLPSPITAEPCFFSRNPDGMSSKANHWFSLLLRGYTEIVV